MSLQQFVTVCATDSALTLLSSHSQWTFINIYTYILFGDVKKKLILSKEMSMRAFVFNLIRENVKWK